MESEAFFSPLFATGALAAVFSTLFLLLAAEVPAMSILQDAINAHVQKAMLFVVTVATAASLYYSEIVGFVPCEFCWFQRIAMYPLFGLLAVTILTRGRLDTKYIVLLATVGLGLSIYHYQLQLFPDQGGVCSAGVSCSGKYVEEYGFITIPFMAGCGFVTVLLLQVAEWRVHYVWRRLA
jgi:disulfide bond formation protein DsbB